MRMAYHNKYSLFASDFSQEGTVLYVDKSGFTRKRVWERLRLVKGSGEFAYKDLIVVTYPSEVKGLAVLTWTYEDENGNTSVSDIFAMGGKCQYILLAISVPGNTAPGDIRSFVRGVNSVARKAGATIIGGDITGSEKLFSVTHTVVGKVPCNRLKLRSDAKPGDRIFMTGQTGYSLAGN